MFVRPSAPPYLCVSVTYSAGPARRLPTTLAQLPLKRKSMATIDPTDWRGADTWRYRQCAVHGCTGRITTASRFCPRHAMRLARHGNPTFIRLQEAELKRHRARIERALWRNRDRIAVRSALEAAQDVLNY